tara:strand:- start:216 stop:950 length:735 start_codon:yes stop_codon:yes gene_type:complete
MKRILISGGNGKFAKSVIQQKGEHLIFAPPKSRMDITELEDIEAAIEIYKPDIFLHAAAYTRPMSKHQENANISIRNNIMGTCNVVLACIKYNVKLVYISTDYVYPGIRGDYNEEDALSPFTGGESDGVAKYGWSKMGGECAVRMYDNSLILRVCMCDHPFPHDYALIDVKKSLMYNFEAAQTVIKLLDEKGVINIGGDAQSVYDFASKENPNIKEINRLDVKDVNIAPNTTMNISKLKEILND